MADAVASAGDRDRIATSLARAFADDPVFRWMIPDARRRRERLPAFFAAMFGIDLRRGTILTTPKRDAASFWRPPGHAATPFGVMAARLGVLVRVFGVLGLWRALIVSRAIEAHFPKGEAFVYLHFVGVDPSAQRRGRGAAMVRAGIGRVPGVAIYLETARPENVSFYLRLGFVVVDEWTIPSGPSFWSMRRAPGAATADAGGAR